MIPGDFVLLLQFGDDEPEVYWERTLGMAQRRGNEIIARRRQSPTMALIYEKNACPARDKMQVVARSAFGKKGTSRLWI